MIEGTCDLSDKVDAIPAELTYIADSITVTIPAAGAATIQIPSQVDGTPVNIFASIGGCTDSACVTQ